MDRRAQLPIPKRQRRKIRVWPDRCTSLTIFKWPHPIPVIPISPLPHLSRTGLSGNASGRGRDFAIRRWPRLTLRRSPGSRPGSSSFFPVYPAAIGRADLMSSALSARNDEFVLGMHSLLGQLRWVRAAKRLALWQTTLGRTILGKDIRFTYSRRNISFSFQGRPFFGVAPGATFLDTQTGLKPVSTVTIQTCTSHALCDMECRCECMHSLALNWTEYQDLAAFPRSVLTILSWSISSSIFTDFFDFLEQMGAAGEVSPHVQCSRFPFLVSPSARMDHGWLANGRSDRSFLNGLVALALFMLRGPCFLTCHC